MYVDTNYVFAGFNVAVSFAVPLLLLWGDIKQIQS
jgi:hypothetical protein